MTPNAQSLALGLSEFVERHIAQLGSLRRADPENIEHGGGELLGVFDSALAQCRAALYGRFVKKSLRGRHGHERANLASASGLPEDRHVGGVAAEIRNIVPHPFERSHQVEHSRIGRVRELVAVFGEIQISESVQPVVEADQDDITSPGNALAIIRLQLLAGSGGKTAAMEPDHDRPFAVVGRGGPDIDAQAVFAGLAIVPFEHERLFVVFPSGAGALRTHLPVIHRTAEARPGLGPPGIRMRR